MSLQRHQGQLAFANTDRYIYIPYCIMGIMSMDLEQPQPDRIIKAKDMREG